MEGTPRLPFPLRRIEYDCGVARNLAMRLADVLLWIALAAGSVAAQLTPPLRIAPDRLAFTAVAEGESSPPQPVAILTADGSPFEFQIEADSGAPGTPPPAWLTLNLKRGSAPARLLVGVSAQGLEPGDYGPARLHVNTSRGLPAGGPIPVTLKVVRRPAELIVEPAALRFEARLGGPDTLEQGLLVRNRGSGRLGAGDISVSSSAGWLRAAVEGCAELCLIRVTVKTQGLRPGPHRGVLRIATPLGRREAPCVLYLAERGAWLEVDPPAAVFQARAGHGTSEQRRVRILNAGEGRLNWKAEILAGRPWLRLDSSAGTATAGEPGLLNLSAQPVTLAPGRHYALVRISSAEAPNSPNYLVAALDLLAADALPAPSFSQTGLFFVITAGEPAPDSESVLLEASSAVALQFQGGVQMYQGASWLSATPTRGEVSTGSPARITLAAAAGLAGGVYRGAAVFCFNQPRPAAVNVVFIVRNTEPERCTASSLAPLATSLPEGFEVRAGLPAPLRLRLLDDCGRPAEDALALATFSNGDPAVALRSVGGGVYAGLWTPRSPAASMAVRFHAWGGAAGGAVSGSTELSGAVLDGRAPGLAPFGILNNLDPQVGAPLAPGTIVQIYGADLAPRTVQPSLVAGRLPAEQDGVSLLIGELPAPLYYLSPGQINAQVPVELLGGRRYQALLASGGAFTLPEPVDLALVAPAVAAFDDGRAIAQDARWRLIDPSHPARPGDYVVIYLTGLGLTDPMVASGLPAPRGPRLAECVFKPQVMLNGRPAEIVFAGLTPDAVGLYQINFRVPPEAAPGEATLIVTQEGVSSKPVTLPVR
jgi:uncharacterized protein (TIGR03437 family)